jgi:Tfp pilus assembly protein PilO
LTKARAKSFLAEHLVKVLLAVLVVVTLGAWTDIRRATGKATDKIEALETRVNTEFVTKEQLGLVDIATRLQDIGERLSRIEGKLEVRP